jgi:hypothetical protein
MDPLGISSLLNSCDCTRSVNRFIINIVCLNISHCVFYRNTPHSVTKETPARLFMGRDLRSCLSLVCPSVKDTVMNSQMDIVFQKSRPERSRYFKVGDRVIARDYKGKDHKWIGYKHARL